MKVMMTMRGKDCIALHHILLHCIALCCIALHYILFYSIASYCTPLHYTTLYHVVSIAYLHDSSDVYPTVT